MHIIKKGSMTQLGYDFVDKSFLPKGTDEYYLRNKQATQREYRTLRREEIIVLQANQNYSDNWNDVLVTEKFNPCFIKNCNFHGLVRIGNLEDVFLEYHGMRYPSGLYNSTIISCDFGDNVSINSVNYISHYIIGNETILFNINEIQTSDKAKFGNGIVKNGESESVRIWLEICNENGGRSILPFNKMLTGDAYIWSKYRNDKTLMKRLVEITEASFDSIRGYYGVVGKQCVIKNCQVIKDVNIGDAAYIKGANKLKNLTINSSFESPTQIGEGVELVNGIVGYSCKIFYGAKAVRFSIGNNSALKYGARLINSVLGENSTISCCEVLNSLIFPGHEQHHNNSFLIAATALGQSNIAAGATIGSNHNSRANDGEIVAGRGFWPGLCVNLKHNSKFASFALLAKGSYSNELNISLPFCLISIDDASGQLQLMPAYWWNYNMYALERNTWKYKQRDMRVIRSQEFEFDYLAPDTVEEIFSAIRLLEYLLDENTLRNENIPYAEISSEIFEASKQAVRVHKPAKAYAAYKDMIHYFSVKSLANYAREKQITDIDVLLKSVEGGYRGTWINLGGQLVESSDEQALRNKIKDGSLNTWSDIHLQYNILDKEYAHKKAKYAMACLHELYGIKDNNSIKKEWNSWLTKAIEIADSIQNRIFESRLKDYQNKFRKMLYDNEEEMNMVLGAIDENQFINESKKELEAFRAELRNLFTV